MSDKSSGFTESALKTRRYRSRTLPDGSIAPLYIAEFEAEADRLMDELAEYLGADAPLLSDYAISREAIYEDEKSV